MRLKRLMPQASLACFVMVLLVVVISTQSASAEPEDVSVRVQLHDGRPAAGATIQLCAPAGAWPAGSECRSAGPFGMLREISLGPPTTAFNLIVRHEGRIWFYTDDAPGRLRPSLSAATALLPDVAVALSPIVVTIPVPIADYEFWYELAPGANLIGWAGGRITFADLFAQAPSVGAVAVLAPSGDRYIFASRNADQPGASGKSGSEPPQSVRHGDPVWFYVPGGEEHTVSFRTPEPREPVIMNRGTAFTAFTGSETTPLGQLAKGLGPAATSIAVLDPNGDPTRRDAARPGDVLQIELSDDRVFLPYHERPLRMVNYGQPMPDVESESVQRDLEAQRRFFSDRFGVSARGVTIYWVQALRSGLSGTTNERSIWLTRPGVFAHEYFHVLQDQSNRHRRGVPIWLSEGSAQYAQWAFQHEGTDTERKYLDDLIDNLRRDSSIAEIRLTDPHNLFSTDWKVAYALGEVALHWLVGQAGESAILEFWRWNPPAGLWTWEAAFEHAFGLSVAQFDEGFGSYLQELEARAAALPALLRVAGRVTHANGDPVSGQIVDLLIEPPGERQRWQAVFAASDGRFETRLEPGTYSIRLRTAGFQTIGYYRAGAPGNFTDAYDERSVLDAVQLADIEIQLPKLELDPAAIRILFTDGTPAVGAYVRICPEDRGGCPTARTLDDGSLSIVLLRDRYTIKFWGTDIPSGFYRAEAPGGYTSDAGQRSAVSSTQLSDLTVRLPTVHTIRGRILDAAGAPLAQTRVQACTNPAGFPSQCELRITSPDGMFSILVPAGQYWLLISGGQVASGYYSGHADGGYSIYPAERTQVDARDADVVDIVIRLPEFYTVSGRVVAASGQPAVGVWLSACREDIFCTSYRTDAEGRFQILVAPGQYPLKVSGKEIVGGYYNPSAADGGLSQTPTLIAVRDSDYSGILITLP